MATLEISARLCMLANHELMDVDEQLPIVESSDPVRLDSEAPDTESLTPLKKDSKKRKLSHLKVAISEATLVEPEDEPMELSIVKSAKKNSSATPSTPTVSSTGSFRTEIKKMLQVPSSELTKYYQIKSNNRLVLLQGQIGDAPYRNHPDTIRDLNEYFEDMKDVSFESNFDFNSFLKEKYSSLIAKLAQDSQVTQSELVSALRAILIPVASGFPELSLNSSLLEGIMEKVSYGHPDAGNNFSSWSCTFWQVKDLSLLGQVIGKHFLTNYVLRNAARMIFETSLVEQRGMKLESPSLPDDESNQTNPVVASINLVEDLLPISLMKIESGTGTPKKRGNKDKHVSTANCNNNQSSASTQSPAIATSIPQVKISSFFAKLKKPDIVERASGEYFQPFFVKPDVTMACPDRLRRLKLEQQANNNSSREDVFNYSSSLDYWKSFRERAVSIPYRKPTCLCVGYDGRPVRTVLKLLKFEENYRPAYLGTWRKCPPSGSVNARRPFGRVPDVDYEYESDAEWDEGEDPEGESLSDIDDDEEEDDEEDVNEENDNVSCAESADSWLVPHGYLSEDEGVDEVHPGELEEAAREAELQPPTANNSTGTSAAPNKRKERRKFVPKEPLLLGPFFSDQVIPQILQGSTVQFADWAVMGRGPFEDCEAVFSSLEASTVSNSSKKASVESSSVEKSVFPETLLASMIQIVESNSFAGMTKLYDEFILQHGRVVSRRLFESKLNQITTGKLKCEKSGKLRWMFKEQYLTYMSASSPDTAMLID